jgi:hypothetical protein
MRFKGIKDTLQLAPTGTLTLTAAQTVTGRIRQEPFRLEYILLVMRFITVGTASTALGPDAIAGLVKNIRVRVNDTIGNRVVVNVTGPAVLSYVKNQIGKLDRHTQAGYFHPGAVTDVALNTTYEIGYMVPLRCLGVAEPFGNFTSLPLSGKFMKEDATLEIDLRPSSEILTGTVVTGATLEAFTQMRAVPDDQPYIPSELITTPVSFAAAGRQAHELASSGWLTGLLIQGYSSTTYAATGTRVNPLAAGGSLLVEYGRDIVCRTSYVAAQMVNDWSQDNSLLVPTLTAALPSYGVGATDVLSKRAMPGEMFLDFLSDGPDVDSWSVASALNLNALGGGDRCRVTFDTWASANYLANITHHKFLPRAASEMAALAVGI